MPCTIDLLHAACTYTYKDPANYIPKHTLDENTTVIRIAAPNENPKDILVMKSLEDEFMEYGYKVHAAKSPTGTGTIHSDLYFGENSGMGYAVLKPIDSKDPIIIAYRGTKSKNDVKQDLKLGVTGVTEEEYRKEAYAVYKKVREIWPDKPIIITGHSLGGHLATYVAVKASSEEKDEAKIHVRTFNGAGLSTDHEDNLISSDQEVIAPNIFHYRLYNDQVGKMPKVGTSITFIGPEQRLLSGVTPHFMANVRQDTPHKMKNIIVGSDSVIEPMKEAVLGFGQTYACRTKSQYGMRDSEVKNNEIIQPMIQKLLIILNDDSEDRENIEKLKDCERIIENAKIEVDKYNDEGGKNPLIGLVFVSEASSQLDLLLKRCRYYMGETLRDTRNIQLQDYSKVKNDPLESLDSERLIKTNVDEQSLIYRKKSIGLLGNKEERKQVIHESLRNLADKNDEYFYDENPKTQKNITTYQLKNISTENTYMLDYEKNRLTTNTLTVTKINSGDPKHLTTKPINNTKDAIVTMNRILEGIQKEDAYDMNANKKIDADIDELDPALYMNVNHIEAMDNSANNSNSNNIKTEDNENYLDTSVEPLAGKSFSDF